MIRVGSVCSGIGAPECAWQHLGWRSAFMSEIDAFPRAVLAHRFPGVPVHGDFTTIQAGHYDAIDLLVGGTPCQSFSVAGLRLGLADERGNLALEYLRLADRLRPRWLVWENVPGVLSSNGGRDFGAFLGGLVQLGYGFAYRVLDAQHFGVAQRRRRVFVVGYLGDWRRAAAVLFEPASMRADSAPRREAGERVAPTLARGSPGGRRYGEDADTADSLVARCLTTGEGNRLDGESCNFVAHTLRASGFDAGEDGTGRGTPLVPCLTSNGDAHSGFRDEHGLVPVAFDTQQITSAANRTRCEPGLPASTLAARSKMHAATTAAVRRLTPRECERLQGFPDYWTLVPLPLKRRQSRVRWAADGPRYKALGNSMAVPVMRWIGERIALADRATPSAPADRLAPVTGWHSSLNSPGAPASGAFSGEGA